MWDAVLVGALAKELNSGLSGARLTALLLDGLGRSLTLYFREGTLALRLDPASGGITLDGPAEPPPQARSFPAVVVSVEAPADDRVLIFQLRRARRPGPGYTLFVELMTNQWNAVVVRDVGGEAVIRHVLRRREGERPLAPGLRYLPPPPSSRAGVDGVLSLADWRALLLPLPPRERKSALLSGVAWTSPLNAAALLGDAAREDGPGAEAALDRGHALWRSLCDPDADRQAVLLERSSGLQPYPLALPGEATRPSSSVLDALRAAANARGESAGAPLPAEWLEALADQADRFRRRAESLSREAASMPDPNVVRAQGDLLLARFAEIPRGSDRVTLEDFEGQPVELELDPTLAPHENAAAYYERGARAERALERLPRLIEQADRRAREAEGLLMRARSGEADTGEVQAALPQDPTPGPGRPGQTLPYRRYRSSEGTEIRVGRGARWNDDLTFHHAAPEDVWLHARHAAGAHVVLRWKGEGNPSARDLTEAAVLAALHSKARTSGSVPVDWTRRKYVRKPRKAPPGAVTLERARTVFVEPDPSLEERLRVD